MPFQLLPHQKIGVDFMIKREPYDGTKTKVFGSILADEMGLGKTIQTIGLIKRSPLKKTILCCPSTLVSMWESQIQKFAPEITVTIFREKGQLANVISKYDKEKLIIIMSYGITYRRPEIFDFEFDRIVCDEAHLFRNKKSKVFGGLSKIKATTKVLLTGTPIQNKIGDLATLINFIIGRDLILSIDFIKHFLKERMLRRKMDDVGIKMPNLKINQIQMDSTTSNQDTLGR